MQRSSAGVLFGVVIAATLALAGGMADAAQCPPDAVASGPVCIDKYEASLWQTTNKDLIAQIQKGTVTLSQLRVARATQLGIRHRDLAANGCPTDGNNCTTVYAVSIPGVAPAQYLSWFQAAAAARNSGKRLPTNAEWQASALGTPDPGTDNRTTDCAISSDLANTGARSRCVSNVGAFDMVGNVWEWVADWVPASTTSIAPLYAGDMNHFAGASTSVGAGALLRGGDHDSGTAAGVFAVDASNTPSEAGDNFFGFRGAR